MTRIELPHRGFGRSMKNMVQVLSGEAEALAERSNWIEVVEKEPGVFEVTDNNLTVKDGDWITEATALGFSQWDEEVEDLDNGSSDEAQVLRHVLAPPLEGRRHDPRPLRRPERRAP